jgi:hypothetical protein
MGQPGPWREGRPGAVRGRAVAVAPVAPGASMGVARAAAGHPPADTAADTPCHVVSAHLPPWRKSLIL